MSISWSYLWLIFAVVCAIIEIVVPTFGFAFAGASALLGALAAYVGLSWPAQAVIFAVSLILGVLLLRPRLIRRLEGSAGVPSRTDALVGKTGRVTEAIDPDHGHGRVTIEGQDWAARAAGPIALGASVRVENADGIVLHVTIEASPTPASPTPGAP